MVKMSWVRTPRSGGSFFQHAWFNGTLNYCTDGWLSLEFVTSGGSRFNGSIRQDQFAELAKEMVLANPEAAIKAFGAAMQTVEIPTPESESVRKVA
jgi:hypothetical protein